MRRRWLVPAIVAAAGVVGVGALLIYNAVSQRDINNQTLFIPKPTSITPEVVLLQKYIRIDTTNPPGNEIATAHYLAGLLARHGIQAEIIESAPGRGNLYARIRGKRPGDGLLLLSHMDVVPADPREWRVPPFSGAATMNQVWGRGALDMKSIGICQLLAFAAVADAHRVPEHDIVLLATADEEAGGAMGVGWLLQHRPDVFAGVRYALNEGGINETEQEKLIYFGVEIGERMKVHVRLRAPSLDAMRQLRIALEPAMSPRDADRILPEVRSFLHGIAPLRLEQAALLDDIDRTVAEGKLWLIAAPYRELMQDTIWARGAVSDDRGATMDVSMYNLPDEDPDARLAWLRGVIAPYGATIEQVVEKNGPAPLSSSDTPLFRLITDEVHQTLGDVKVGTEVLAVWSNDSRYLRPRGITCYGMWPFAVDFFQTQGIHGTDERVRIDWYMQGVALMRRLVSRYAFGR